MCSSRFFFKKTYSGGIEGKELCPLNVWHKALSIEPRAVIGLPNFPLSSNIHEYTRVGGKFVNTDVILTKFQLMINIDDISKITTKLLQWYSKVLKIKLSLPTVYY